MQRLRRRRDFVHAYEQGRRLRTSHLLVYASPREEDAPEGFRVGFAVGKRFGGAVARNRLRRVLREACRSALLEPEARWDLVIVPRPEAAEAAFADLAAELREISQRLILAKEQEAR